MVRKGFKVMGRENQESAAIDDVVAAGDCESY